MLRSSFQMIQLKSVFKFRKYFSDFRFLWQILTQKMDPWFCRISLVHSDHRGTRDSVDFRWLPGLCLICRVHSSAWWGRLGRLMELQGIAPSSLAGAAAAGTVSEQKSNRASGGGGATATAAEAGLVHAPNALLAPH